MNFEYFKKNPLSTAGGFIGLVLASVIIWRSPDPIAVATSAEMIGLVGLSLGAIAGQDPKGTK